MGWWWVLGGIIVFAILAYILDNIDLRTTYNNGPIDTKPSEPEPYTYDSKPEEPPYVPSYNEDAHYNYDGSVIDHNK